MMQVTTPNDVSEEAQLRELENFFDIAASILAREMQPEASESIRILPKSEIALEPIAA